MFSEATANNAEVIGMLIVVFGFLGIVIAGIVTSAADSTKRRRGSDSTAKSTNSSYIEHSRSAPAAGTNRSVQAPSGEAEKVRRAPAPNSYPRSPSSSVVTDGSAPPPGRCPLCGGVWVRRINQTTSGRFWGCSGYPRCKNTWIRPTTRPRVEPTKPTRTTGGSTPRRQAQVQQRPQGMRSRSTMPSRSKVDSSTRDLSLHSTVEQKQRARLFWAQSHPNGLLERCPAGHEFTESNTYYRDRTAETGRIERECRTCRKAWR